MYVDIFRIPAVLYGWSQQLKVFSERWGGCLRFDVFVGRHLLYQKKERQFFKIVGAFKGDLGLTASILGEVMLCVWLVFVDLLESLGFFLRNFSNPNQLQIEAIDPQHSKMIWHGPVTHDQHTSIKPF